MAFSDFTVGASPCAHVAAGSSSADLAAPMTIWEELYVNLHQLWGKWHDGAPYDQSVKDQWGALLSIVQRLEAEAKARGADESRAKPGAV